MTQTLLLLDGNSLLNRAYFALPPLNSSNGQNVNAVYGFVNLMLKALEEYKPNKLVVTFDLHGDNFRKQIYPEYKANRHGMAEDLASQMPVLHNLLSAMQVTVVEKAGVEADDIIGTLCKRFEGNSLIVSGDRDMLQLVSENVNVLLTKKGMTDVERVTPAVLKENYGLTPNGVIEFKALRGDTSDNIPGVKGIGEKTAMSLLETYGNIDNLYEHLDEQKGALYQKLADGREMAFVSRTLATIVCNADVSCNFESGCNLPVFNGEVKSMMESLQFRSILSRVSFDASATQQTLQKNVITEEVTTLTQLQSVVREMQQAPYFAFVYDKTVTLACSNEKEYKIYVSDSFIDEMTYDNVFLTLKPLLEGNCAKAVYDGKALKHILAEQGVGLANVLYDAGLMQYLVEYRAFKDLPSLCEAYGYTGVGAGLFDVVQILNKKLAENGVKDLYYNVELPLSDLLYSMECEGVIIDIGVLDALSAEMHQRLNALTAEIHQLTGEVFNVSSPRQVAAVLFEHLGLKHGKKLKTGYSTKSDVLEELVDEHPAIAKILEYRKVSKLLSTYVDGLKPLIKKQLIHTTYNQALTSTGRLSSSEPNLQNIPIRTEEGRELRKMFLPKNGVFVGADYSQIELRLLAAFSGDENLLDAFRNGIDIHTKVASEIMGVPVEMVTKEMRRTAKAVNFGIIYGISDFGLSNSTKLTVRKAHDYIERYFARFPKIKIYLDGLVDFAKKNGYVQTITGRRRQIPEITSTNFNLRSFGERAAMNMPLQGSAADVMKIAMLGVDKAIKSAGLKSRIVMQIHDEIIVDCFAEEAERVKQIVKSEMENAVSLACPLVADLEEGANLYEA